MSVADEATGVGCVTMDTDRYPATLDIGVGAAAHKSGYVHAAADTARDVQVLDGVVFARSERAVSTIEGQRMAVAIERTLEVRSRMVYREVGIQNGVHALRATVGQCCAECFPVIGIVDDAAELLGGIAVGD